MNVHYRNYPRQWRLRVIYLRRWSYVCLGKNDKKFAIVTVYQVGRNRNAGDATAFQQQYRTQYADDTARVEITPHKQTTIDLEYFTEELRTDDFEVVVFIDANETLDHRVRSQNHDHKYKSDKGFHIDGSIDGSIATYTQNCGLSNILFEPHSEYGADILNTHLRGSKQIDFVLTIAGIAPFLQSIGLLDFDVIFQTDHRTFFIHIDMDGLFGSETETLPAQRLRQLQLEDPRVATEYRKVLHQKFIHHSVFRRIKEQLESSKSGEWNMAQESKYEGLDRNITQDILHAESVCLLKHNHNTPWSPAIGRATSLIYPGVTTEDFMSCFVCVGEKTSSSPSSRHVGHYLACIDLKDELSVLIAAVHAAMISIPLAEGFCPKRWRQAIVIMLEKIPGVPRINKLRIVQLLKAGLNQVLQSAFARNISKLAQETPGIISEHQYGRSYQMCVTPVMNKLLTVQLLIQKKTNRILFDNNAKGCYNRIFSGIALAALRRIGYSNNSVRMLGLLWAQLEHHVATGFGVSDASYKSTMNKLLYGIGQGICSSPIVWALLNQLLLTALGEEFDCISLVSVDGITTDTRPGDSFVDDTTTGATDDNHNREPIPSTVRGLAQEEDR
jgi:hypothetical protein